MITLFINSITEYRYDLQQLETSKSIPDMKKLIHKLKPSVLSMEVQGAKDIIPKLEEADEWSEDIAAQVTKLVEIFTTIKPMMEKDLEEIN